MVGAADTDKTPARSCPALFFCAPASGHGKTTITAGIARHHRNRGRTVRVFKTGPDYLDPLILERASGNPVTQLDLWMVGEEECRAILFEAAADADLILVEGVMGMFDGVPSGADMAGFFGIPIAIVIDARSMAQTFGALAMGLATFRPELDIAGVVANNTGSDRHRDLITDSMPPRTTLLGCVPAVPEMSLPERHLGLVRPGEVADMDQRLDRIAAVVAASGLTDLPAPVAFTGAAAAAAPPRLLESATVAVARDDAFCFIYAANLKLLEDMGARCVFFSPLANEPVPSCDAVWLPGGYPEVHHHRLSANDVARRSLKEFHASGGRILAECGGMLYLMESLTDVTGDSACMLGILPGRGIMRDRGGCQGMQTAPLPEGELRAHAHHRTRCEGTLEPIAHGRRLRHPAPGEPVYRTGGVTASYLHLYFPSNPEAVAALLR